MAAEPHRDYNPNIVHVSLTRRASKQIDLREWGTAAAVKHEYSAATVGRRRHVAEMVVRRHARTGVVLISARLEQPTPDDYLRSAGVELAPGEDIAAAVARVAGELDIAPEIVQRVLAQLDGR
jgi:hypothetical protein